MGRKRLHCVALECDACGCGLEGQHDAFVRRYPENKVRLLEADAGRTGWTTDGLGRWHCAGCPELEDRRTRTPAAVQTAHAVVPDTLAELEDQLVRLAGVATRTAAAVAGRSRR